jgi:hypothetical protein
MALARFSITLLHLQKAHLRQGYKAGEGDPGDQRACVALLARSKRPPGKQSRLGIG